MALFVRVHPERWLPPAISVRLVRRLSDPGNAAASERMRAALPVGGRRVRHDLVYDPATGRDGLFDLVLPDGDGPFPVLVWLHGGGWISGSKADPLPYLELLATRGFAGAVLNYPLAPGSRHPAAPLAALQALDHLVEHAAEHDIDPGRIVLAGDSAGAQVAASAALACVDPGYAAALGRGTPPVPVRATVGFGGTFDPPALLHADRTFRAVLASAMWAVAGRRRWARSATAQQMTIREHATASYPPTFLRAGNADPLTAGGTVPLAARLAELGTDLDQRIVGDAGEPLHHQYQFVLTSPAAQRSFEELVGFLERVTAGPSNSH